MPIKVEGRRIIRAPVQKVFQLVSRPEAHPHVTGLWLSADLLDRRPNQVTVHYRGYFAGVPMESVQRATISPPHRVEFRQTRGGLRALRGQFAVSPVESETELTMSLEADIGIPLIPDAAAHRVLQTYVERTLDKFKLTAERDLPRVVRRAREDQAPVAEKVPPPPPGPVPALEDGAAVETPLVAAEPPAGTQEPTPPMVSRRGRRRRGKRRRRSTRSTGSTASTESSESTPNERSSDPKDPSDPVDLEDR